MTHGWWEASACHTCFCWQLVQLVLCAACGTGQHCVLSGCCVAERLCVCVFGSKSHRQQERGALDVKQPSAGLKRCCAWLATFCGTLPVFARPPYWCCVGPASRQHSAGA